MKSAERKVGIMVFHRMPKFNQSRSIIFFFSMIFFGCVRKKLGIDGDFGKIVQFARS